MTCKEGEQSSVAIIDIDTATSYAPKRVGNNEAIVVYAIKTRIAEQDNVTSNPYTNTV